MKPTRMTIYMLAFLNALRALRRWKNLGFDGAAQSSRAFAQSCILMWRYHADRCARQAVAAEAASAAA
jgi:hypothetical protein